MILVTDTLNNDDIVIGFNSTSSTKFNGDEDAQFIPGSFSVQSIAVITSDSIKTSAKWVPLPPIHFNTRLLNLNVTAKATGQLILF